MVRYFAGLVLALGVLLAPKTALANSGGEGPDEVSMVLGLMLVLGACTLMTKVMDLLKMPAILGQILAGIFVSNLPIPGMTHLLQSEFLALFGGFGVIGLMFKSGLEAEPDSIKANLVKASVVAGLGVLVVGIVGAGVAYAMYPQAHWLTWVYIGAALTPTSAGIGASLFQAKGQLKSPAGTTTVVAAVLDDVGGLVVMAALGALAGSVAKGGSIDWAHIGWEATKGVGFVGVAFFLGVWIFPRFEKKPIKIHNPQLILGAAMSLCLLFAFLGAKFAGLAPLIGGYAAGLLFQQLRYREEGHNHELEHAVDPVVSVTAPVFFFLVGTKVPASAFLQPKVLLLAILLTMATVIGKIVSCVVVKKEDGRMAVIAGMMPRGEVASIMVKGGAAITLSGTALISTDVFTAFVLMITFTTLLSIFGLNKFLPNAAEAEVSPPSESSDASPASHNPSSVTRQD